MTHLLPGKRQWMSKLLSGRAIFFISAIITWPFLSEFELFEKFYEFSRAHEDWDLDEFALLLINLSIALTVSSWHQSHRLKRLVAEREFERQRAEKNALYDPLTGLINRRAFSAILDETGPNLPGQNQRYIAMMDLDKFKPINDLHGHAMGDKTLVGVAQRLEAEIGSDGVVARLGGDEFAVMFAPTVSSEQAERIARRVVHSIGQAFDFDGVQMRIGCSIGLAQWTPEGTSSDALGHADRALYSAKSQGRNQFAWYDADLDRESIARAEIESDLRAAIENQEIQPFFQPIVDIETNMLTGFEVLARWTHARHGQIPPAVFIEIAEDSGQIGTLGLSLLRQACTAARGWDSRLSISFNVSAHQFHDPNLVDNIREILATSGLNPKRITLEITESTVIGDFDVARKKLEQLKGIGISVALDDFGTGYSSLASLRQLPFDRIKIDRSFVTNISALPQNQKIVAGIMSLATGLELDVTAEGIETTEDLEFVKMLNCTLGQGFLFEQAISADAVSWLLETEWGELRLNPTERGAVEAQLSKAG